MLPFRRAVYLLLQEVVQQRSDGGNGGKLPDFAPCRRDSRAQNIGTQFKFQREREPASKTQTNIFCTRMLWLNFRLRTLKKNKDGPYSSL